MSGVREMDAAFRATMANYDRGYKDGYSEGRSEGRRSGYDEGYDEGYEAGKTDAERAALTEADLWDGMVDEALDRLIRYFDLTAPAVSDALRGVGRDLSHPSHIWTPPKPEKRT